MSRSSMRSSPVETAVMKLRMMKRRSMNVFTPASRTQGVGHAWSDALKRLPRPGIEPRFKV